LEKVSKTFSQSRGAKKSKIADKISRRIEVFKEAWSKNGFCCKITFKI
jgi:hypothetical protein